MGNMKHFFVVNYEFAVLRRLIPHFCVAQCISEHSTYVLGAHWTISNKDVSSKVALLLKACFLGEGIGELILKNKDKYVYEIALICKVSY